MRQPERLPYKIRCALATPEDVLPQVRNATSAKAWQSA
jgi:hypothetical protein